MFRAIIFILTLALCTQGYAATYYVDKDSIGGTCNNNNAGTAIGAPWCTIAKANTTATAGDIVNIRAATYSEQINPSNSGSAGNYITFQNYSAETVEIALPNAPAPSNNGVFIANTRSYIRVKGLRIVSATDTFEEPVQIEGSYNIIEDCYIESNRGSAIYIRNSLANYNQILNNTVTNRVTMPVAENDERDLIGLLGSNNHNLVQGNDLSRGTHFNIGLGEAAERNVIRNNTLYDAGDINYGQNNIGASDSRNLIENNIFINWGLQQTAGDDVHAAQHNNILRYNNHRATGSVGTHIYGLYTDGGDEVTGNRIYNNTAVSSPGDIFALEKSSDGQRDVSNNRIKNNLFWKSTGNRVLFQNCAAASCNEYAPWTDVIYAYNFLSESTAGQNIAYFETGNGVFNSYTLTQLQTNWASLFHNNIEGNGDPLLTNEGAHDYTLQEGSPCINAGGHLTNVAVADTGSGTSLILDDAWYFQAGWGVPTVLNDFIAVGTVGNTVEITAINYSTHTLTLASAISRIDGDPVWLYKDSDGTVVLSGSAPDMGANEYDEGEPPPPPPPPADASIGKFEGVGNFR